MPSPRLFGKPCPLHALLDELRPFTGHDSVTEADHRLLHDVLRTGSNPLDSAVAVAQIVKRQLQTG